MGIKKHRHAVHAEPVTFLFFTLSQMCRSSYVCMQVSRNLADNNTPKLCLPNAFWGTRDFIIAFSSQSRGQHIACVAARVTEILPKRAGKHLKAQSSYSFYFITVFICL